MDDPGQARGLDVAAVQRGFELFNAGDLPTLFSEVFDPEISYRGDPQISALAGFSTDHEGIVGVRAVWEGFFAMFEEVVLSEVELHAEGEQTVTGSCRMITHGGGSGVPIDVPFHFAWVLRGQRWRFMAAKLDREQTLAALGEWKAAAQSGQ